MKLKTDNRPAMFMKNSYLFQTLIVMSLIFCGCEKEIDYRTEINDLMENLPPISQGMPSEKSALVDSSGEEKDQEYIYKIDYYSAAAGFNEQIVLNPQTDVIYPGALIKGESILDGSYIPISANRNPITISTSLTGSGNVSVEVDDPKLSKVREAVNSLMSQDYDVPPANMGFTVEQAYSESQLKLSLRASYSGIVDVSGGFDYSNKKVKTRLVAKFIQNYYTLDMDLPSRPSDLFADDVKTALFGTYMPMYISSVTYGRMALFTIESELEESAVRSFLQGSYASIDASASAEFEELTTSSTMKVYVLGGSGADAGMTIDGFEAFKSYIKAGGNYSKESPGAPISYKLRYINDNSIGKIVFAASYPIRTAIPRTDNLRYDVDIYYYQLKSHVDDWGSGSELRGYANSYMKNNKEATLHNHFQAINMPQYGTTTYPENSVTKVSRTGLTQDDSITIHLDIWEDNDFDFPESYRDFTVPDFVLETGLSQGVYDTRDELILYALGHGTTYYVIPRFKFIYNTYRVGDP